MDSFTRALRNRCPACGEAPLFDGWFSLHVTCPRCSVRHERFDGSWTIATWICSSIGVTVGGLLAVLLYTQEGFTAGLEFVIVGVGVLVAVATYRPVKALTFGGLHAAGLVHADPVQVGNVIYLQRYKMQREGRDEGGDEAAQVEGA